MNTIAIVQYILTSAVLVLSFFFAMRCLFVHEMRLEAWRGCIKHQIYTDRRSFERTIRYIGWTFLMIFIWASFTQFLQFFERFA